MEQSSQSNERESLIVDSNTIFFPQEKSFYKIRKEIKKFSKSILLYKKKLTESDIKSQQNHSFYWFLDNYYLLKEQINILNRDFPQKFCNTLPRIKDGKNKVLPRIFELINPLINKLEGKIEISELENYLLDFQTQNELTTGEIWATTIALRIGLIEELIKQLELVIKRAKEGLHAEIVANKLFEIVATEDFEQIDLMKFLKQELQAANKITDTFITELLTRIKDQDPAFHEMIQSLKEDLKLTSEELQELFIKEHVEQAKNQIIISNIINSIRTITKMEWHPFFEKISKTNSILKNDPANEYDQMDAQTKDSYRKEVEKISRDFKIRESYVAKACLSLAQDKAIHVGFILFRDGRKDLFEKLKVNDGPIQELKTFIGSHPAQFYFSMIIIIFAFSYLTLLYLLRAPDLNYYLNIFLGMILILPASEFSIGIVNIIITQVKKPKNLFKMDFRKEIPSIHKTMVVIPCLLINKKTIDELTQQIELHYLSNKDDNIFFGILGDLTDHNEEIKADDNELIEYTTKKIENLNGRHRGSEKFFFFHRKRKWNSSEDKWICYERKRGKISEFNELIRGNKQTTFQANNIDWELFKNIQYIITLDADTQLPIDAAKKLIGTIAHPLNTPVFDETTKKIKSGYAIIQPRVSVSMISSIQTRFAQIFSGNTGLDPYTTAVSDVYQDLFSEGNYTGKGLYHIDAFEKVLKDIIPENIILSHDLFEGCLARVGLATDIELYDDYPENFTVFSKRNHRWVRGDWQLIGWLKKNVRNARNEKIQNPISYLGRWKILDNLRRSLVAPATMISLGLIWIESNLNSVIWSALIIIAINSSVICSILIDIVKVRQNSIHEHIKNNSLALRIKFEQIFLMMVYLPEMSLVNCDAIIRSLYRTIVSKKNKLEWVSFSQIQNGHKTNDWKDLISFGPLFSFNLFLLIYFLNKEALLISFPFITSWLLTPYITYGTQRKIPPKYLPLKEQEINEFRRYARLTWHFFEHFANAEDNWLAPDNFQEEPMPKVAHRTSPTNIGLQLISNLSAFDLGYISLNKFMELTEKKLITIQKLEKYKGHLYNWYDTQSLLPLTPKYISTVDSGNLAGYLITLKQGAIELADNLTEILSRTNKEGIQDCLNLINEKIDNCESKKNAWVLKIKSIINLMNQDLIKLDLNQISLKSKQIVKLLTEMSDEDRDKNYFEMIILSQNLASLIENLIEDKNLNLNKTRMRLKTIAYQAHDIAYGMDFKFLFDQDKMIFSIGVNESEAKPDRSYYDLLASESRLASYFAIAKGDIPSEHWFRLGRQMVQTKSGRVLVSWSATMFEYLMPLLIMRRYEDSLLDQTYESIVSDQIKHGERNKTPWGISESGYNARDLHYNYQYAAFGIPEIGLKTSSHENHVISPYSTMLASMVTPQESLKNLKQLENLGMLGQFGFYESLDYSKSRIPKDQNFTIVKSFMAHHQGMSLVSFNNLINNQIMQRRFHAENRVRATQILLQERSPIAVKITSKLKDNETPEQELKLQNKEPYRKTGNIIDSYLHSQVLSNSKLSLMISGVGDGYLKLDSHYLGRWKNDHFNGQEILLGDKDNDHIFSYRCLKNEPRIIRAETILAEENVEFIRETSDIKMETSIIVSCENNVEIRKIRITNKTDRVKELELGTFQELALCPPKAYNTHPSFYNLFVRTQYLPDYKALVAKRQDHHSEKKIFSFQMLNPEIDNQEIELFETDKSKIITRYNQRATHYFDMNASFEKSTGAVLDPIFAFKKKFSVRPQESINYYLVTGLAYEENDLQRLIQKYSRVNFFESEFKLSWVTSQNLLQHLKIDLSKTFVYQQICSALFRYHQISKKQRTHIEKNNLTQPDLWSLGISGDAPILTITLKSEKNIRTIRDLLHAHEYLGLKGHSFDLVILNQEDKGYLNKVNDEIIRQITICNSFHHMNKPCGIFIFSTQQIGEEKTNLILAISNLTFIAEAGDLATQINRHEKNKRKDIEQKQKSIIKKRNLTISNEKSPFASTKDLDYYNSFGGFINNGMTYRMLVNDQISPPAPWINVIANNPNFGFQISEAGQGFTWAINSRQNRLTKWTNDALSEEMSEFLIIENLETTDLWSPTPLPMSDGLNYLIDFTPGIVTFKHDSSGIIQTLKMLAPLNDHLKIIELNLKNKNDKTQALKISYFIDWQVSAPDDYFRPIELYWDDSLKILTAKNSYHKDFSTKISFFTSSQEPSSVHTELPNSPFLHKNFLSNSNYSSLTIIIKIPAFEDRNLIFLLGQEESFAKIIDLKNKYSQDNQIEQTIKEVEESWTQTLSKIQIETPSKQLNILFNNWLLYQTLSCRIWARSAFYQSGGAYGFRDQLQDVMAMIYSSPKLTRDHILLSASHQFTDGDVQHWWHPPTGQGIRTKFSDDLLWLPYVVSFYINITEDFSILENEIPYLEPVDIPEGQDEIYFNPKVSATTGSLYEHCLKAILRSMPTGEHGLPLMGSGDWNDGMNKVGHEGKGESVWLSWFLMATLKNFLPICERSNDYHHLNLFQSHISKLQISTEANAWDGDWYVRAFFDNGEKIGSKENQECKIDSIAQSWAILSNSGEKKRSRKAIESAYDRLFDIQNKIIKLFDPPFEKSAQNPGYIKNYLPGVRENGGQYTHAGIWLMMAFAEVGDSEKTWKLLEALNPINHSLDEKSANQYKLEPYVVAADIYSEDPNIGRGGWSWYTGSSGWLYRAILESFIGLKLNGDELQFKPCLPQEWEMVKIDFRYEDKIIHIKLINSPTDQPFLINGIEAPFPAIKLDKDLAQNDITINLPFSKLMEQ